MALLNIQKTLAVQGYGSGGTIFAQGLLDGHPRIMSLPVIHGSGLYGFWEGFSPQPTNLLAKFFELHDHWFNPDKVDAHNGLTQMGPLKDEKVFIDKEVFAANLLKLLSGKTITRKMFIVAVYQAYNEVLGRTYDDDCILLFPIHNLPGKYVVHLAEDFASVKCLYMVRETVKNSGSLSRNYVHLGLHKIFVLEGVAAWLFGDFLIHRGNYRVGGLEPYIPDTPDGKIQNRAVRLEDLHLKNRQTLDALCAWLDIAWNDALLKTTFDGKQWNNFAGKISVSGATKAVLDQQYADVQWAFDRYRIGLLSWPVYRAFGYSDKIRPSQAFVRKFILPFLLLLPFKAECLKERIAEKCRLLKSERGQKPAWTFPLACIAYLAEGYVRARKWLFLAWRSEYRAPLATVPLLAIGDVP